MSPTQILPNGCVFPVSLLDTDLYKLTMQQAILHHFPNVQSTYRFTNRDQKKGRYFTRKCYDLFKASLPYFANLALTDVEHEWLRKTCPYLTAEYLDYLHKFRPHPEQVKVTFEPVSKDGQLGNIEIEAVGLWVEAIYWEVPLMSTLSEIHFTTGDTDWSYVGQDAMAYKKGRILLEAGCTFSEFGTRRRRSFRTQDVVVQALIRAARDFPGKGALSGTSNVHLAMKYGVQPIGTIAHEWFMGVATLKGYQNCSGIALDLWEAVYPNALHFALTDTFSTEVFYRDFVADPDRARRWKGLRQDSGDPFIYAPRAKQIYESLGIDYRTKSLIFSDAIDLEKALGLKKQCDELGFPCTFGIGTWLTNSFNKSSDENEPSKALNMVIKLASVDGKPCVKISDEIMKNTGDPTTVKSVKDIFGLPHE
ncbi:hypothetical protein JAAARDRAFT_28022 [Jaapia argillacea MUCL 33604]|uniref:Nicotinate phosphoribosyltransferase n=1 Tax=Jaapia argillacea MUCL 33604 TaxID=933084 RepID=A0A067QBP7_9AGAM|nr:hypothetical protein JAAARDRAFT_28022 [Jaapia argillacea MUCL 33604]